MLKEFLRWISIWKKIVSQPGEETFRSLNAAAQPRIAYLWIFLAGFLFVMCSGISYVLASTGINFGIPALTKLLGAAVLIGGALVVSFAASVAIKQWIAKRCGGTGAYPGLAYAFGAIYAPFALVSSAFVLLGAIRFIRMGAWIIIGLAFLYALFLQITAVKANNHFGWQAAAVSVLIPFAAVLVFCNFAIPVGFAILDFQF